jgi:hypothetical protein
MTPCVMLLAETKNNPYLSIADVAVCLFVPLYMHMLVGWLEHCEVSLSLVIPWYLLMWP